jgi:hypothetical protein
MVIDKKLIDSWENQIAVLVKLQESVKDATDRAKKNYAALSDPKNFGRNLEDVFLSALPKHGSAAQGGHSKDHP